MTKLFKQLGKWFDSLPRHYQWLLAAAFIAVGMLNFMLGEQIGEPIGRALYRSLH